MNSNRDLTKSLTELESKQSIAANKKKGTGVLVCMFAYKYARTHM